MKSSLHGDGLPAGGRGAGMSKARVWLLAARPRTLPAALAPVLVGTALAASDGRFSAVPALAAFLGALLLQILSNLANDYFDFLKGADTSERVGPTRAMAAGLLSKGEMRAAMVIVAGLAVLDGLLLVALAGWPILVVGVASLLAALLYTGGPFPFGYHGLGDLFVFVFFGLVAVSGTYYAQAGALTAGALVTAVPVGALVTAILVVNNLRDIKTDAAAGKDTLAVLIGPAKTRLQFLALLALAYASPFLLWLGLGLGLPTLLPLLAIPIAVLLARDIYAGTGSELNLVLAKSARHALAYSLLLSLGLIL